MVKYYVGFKHAVSRSSSDNNNLNLKSGFLLKTRTKEKELVVTIQMKKSWKK